jgi:hypothetical protein
MTATARAIRHREVFQRLHGLVGRWRGETELGRVLTVDRIEADGSLWRSETYLAAGREDTEAVVYRRQDGGSAGVARR